jgi:hypothetical protein
LAVGNPIVLPSFFPSKTFPKQVLYKLHLHEHIQELNIFFNHHRNIQKVNKYFRASNDFKFQSLKGFISAEDIIQFTFYKDYITNLNLFS